MLPPRDAQGHFISRQEAAAQGRTDGITGTEDGAVETEPMAEEPRPQQQFGEGQRQAEAESVHVDTGRGNTVEVPAGSPFVPTLERLAEEAHYGGYFRIFLNGSEVINPEDSPETIEPGQRIVITSYDKVG